MAMHVNIGEAKTCLSELVAAAVRGEDVVLAKAGAPQVRLVPVSDGTTADEKAAKAARRLAAFGMWKGVLTEEQSIVPPSMTDEELEERWTRKFGPAA